MTNEISTEVGGDSALTGAKSAFAKFLQANPNSSIEEVDSRVGKGLAVTRPWGDSGLAIFLPQDISALADALNNLILPEAFTAIWHADTKTLEVIWTAFPLPSRHMEVMEREFVFCFDGNEHKCAFGPSSGRLLTIAEHARPIGVSNSHHRNLSSYSQYVRWRHQRTQNADLPPLPGGPVSFWVHNLEWDEERALRFARHLNFYMTYYDSESPDMYIWSPETETEISKSRYLTGAFPALIHGYEVNDDLLHLWAAARNGDAARRLTYLYRIIEYASYTYIERDIRDKISKLLAAPHAFGDTRTLTEQVIAVANASKMEDIRRITALLSDAVDASRLWEEIEQNRAAFERPACFDGGFELQALLAPADTEATFVNSGVERFGRLAREIRNHLSHGRDRTSQASITPTRKNFYKLEPWVVALSFAAGEVVRHTQFVR